MLELEEDPDVAGIGSGVAGDWKRIRTKFLEGGQDVVVRCRLEGALLLDGDWEGRCCYRICCCGRCCCRRVPLLLEVSEARLIVIQTRLIEGNCTTVSEAGSVASYGRCCCLFRKTRSYRLMDP